MILSRELICGNGFRSMDPEGTAHTARGLRPAPPTKLPLVISSSAVTQRGKRSKSTYSLCCVKSNTKWLSFVTLISKLKLDFYLFYRAYQFCPEEEDEEEETRDTAEGSGEGEGEGGEAGDESGEEGGEDEQNERPLVLGPPMPPAPPSPPAPPAPPAGL